jgi:hypothetical protein
MATQKTLSEKELYPIIEAALRTEGLRILKLAELARRTGLASIERKAQELAEEGRPVTDEERGKAFWALIRQAIERLRPEDLEPNYLIPQWHPYLILYEEYILGTDNRLIADKLHISEREMLRRRQRAVERVVRQLFQWG